MLVAGSSASAIIEDNDGREIREKLEMVVRAVLSGVQDDLSKYLHEPWPADVTGGMAMPAARGGAGEVRLWYGGDEGEPVIGMPAIRITEIMEP